MSTDLTWQIASGSSKQTEQLAEQVGSNLKGGEVVDLISDLGGGKTTFVRGLVCGIGSQDHVNSPTFKLKNVYHGKNLTLNHFDFYRLKDAGLMAHELEEVVGDSGQVVAVEWAKIISDLLPARRLKVGFVVTGTGERNIKFSYPKQLSYLLEGLK